MALETRAGKGALGMLRIRFRCTIGFILGFIALVLLDLRYWIWPRLTGKRRRKQNLR
ncbi:MAG: hypothetical protein RDV00_07150 [Clostridia bacterium]|nr:hypothetical protein [Clostridia bacterium]MDQ7791875.1 hypothetical protein [Clostridia bacterium]